MSDRCILLLQSALLRALHQQVGMSNMFHLPCPSDCTAIRARKKARRVLTTSGWVSATGTVVILRFYNQW